MKIHMNGMNPDSLKVLDDDGNDLTSKLLISKLEFKVGAGSGGGAVYQI